MNKKRHRLIKQINGTVAITLAMSAATPGLASKSVAAPAAPSIAVTLVTTGDGRSVPACASCHGQAGEGRPASGFPRLAGLSASYIKKQLAAFASGNRQNGEMTTYAQALAPAQTQALADYYAHLPIPPQTAPVETATPAQLALGQQLAEFGRWSAGIPACEQCHGHGGTGVGENFPALAGQSPFYLVNQLRAWQKGTRDDGIQQLMGPIARRLSIDDIHAVALWLSQQPPSAQEHSP